jgi:hypothetical protein
MKSKLKGAETGHSLLKRKSEALTKYAASNFKPDRPMLTLFLPPGVFEVMTTTSIPTGLHPSSPTEY